jgi:hypothetical protein
MLCPSGSEFIDQVIGYIDLPVAKMFYIPGESQRYIFGITDLTLTFDVSVLVINKANIIYQAFNASSENEIQICIKKLVICRFTYEFVVCI